MDTDEQHPIQCNITIGEEEAVGISSLEMPVVIGAFQLPSEGIIYFQIEGMKEPIEFDDLHTSDLCKILKELQ